VSLPDNAQLVDTRSTAQRSVRNAGGPTRDRWRTKPSPNQFKSCSRRGCGRQRLPQIFVSPRHTNIQSLFVVT